MADLIVKFRGPAWGFFSSSQAERVVSQILEAAEILRPGRQKTLCLSFDDYEIRSIYDSKESDGIKKALLGLNLILRYYLAEIGPDRELVVENSLSKNPEIAIWVNKRRGEIIYSTSGEACANRPQIVFSLDQPIEDQVLQKIRHGLMKESLLTVFSASEFEEALSVFEKSARISQVQKRVFSGKDFFRLSLRGIERVETSIESASALLTRTAVFDLISNRLDRLRKVLSGLVDIKEIEVADGEWKAFFFFEEGLLSLPSVENVKKAARALASFDSKGLVCLSPRERKAKKIWPSFDIYVSRSGEVQISLREGSSLLDVEVFSEFGIKACSFLAANPKRARTLLLLYRLSKRGVIDSLKEDFEKVLDLSLSQALLLKEKPQQEKRKARVL